MFWFCFCVWWLGYIPGGDVGFDVGLALGVLYLVFGLVFYFRWCLIVRRCMLTWCDVGLD